jgi:DNA-binding IclR family transcriptional regulator
MAALANAIRVLRCFSEQEPELRLTEISRRLGLSKSNTHFIVSTLAEERLLYRHATTGKYRLGLGLFELGALALSPVGLGTLPTAAVAELGQQTQETVLLGILDDYDVVYVQRVESPHILRISHADVSRAPAHCTATGKALLAWSPDDVVARVIRHGLTPYAARTITDPQAFREHLADVRRRGYAVTDNERVRGTRAASAPVRDRSGEVVAALTVAAPTQRLARSEFPRLAAIVMKAAGRVSRELCTADADVGHRLRQETALPR